MAKDQEFEKYLQEISDPKNSSEVNYGLPKNPTSLQVAKYKLCKSILGYKQENKLTTEDTAKKLGLDIPQTEYILFSHIDKFQLDELINYADNLHLPFKLVINGSHVNQKATAEAH